jgi:UDP-N-acetylmuramate--alanine ligase
MKHIHLVGIGGTGLSAIARVLLERGYQVSGSDLELSPLARDLDEAGVKVFLGHKPEHVQGVDMVIQSSAVPVDNVEIQAALAAGIPVYKRADFLGQLMNGCQGIAVAGSHGKTTTSAMIAWVLNELGQDPSFIVGGVVSNLVTNAHAGGGPYFVIEADEYDHMFLGLTPEIAVVTNIEHDHPDLFPTPEAFYHAFQEFSKRLPSDGQMLVCGDDPGAARLGKETTVRGISTLTYGAPGPSSPVQEPDYVARNLQMGPRGGYVFEAYCGERKLAKVSLQIPGIHNVRNALGALAVVDQLALSPVDAARALGEFRGARRRFQVLGEADGVIVIDDYAHHPTEIKATLAAARTVYPNRSLWAVWQPHTYTRTKALYVDFLTAFEDADHVIVMDVYRAREPLDPDFSVTDFVSAMEHPDVYFISGLEATTSFLLLHLQAGDVLLVLSAGDADQVSSWVLAGLEPNSILID